MHVSVPVKFHVLCFFCFTLDCTAGSFRNAKQRSRSADPLNCTQSQHSVLSQPRLFLPANPNPNPPPRIIRTTASSRGRDAFINSRVPHFDEVCLLPAFVVWCYHDVLGIIFGRSVESS